MDPTPFGVDADVAVAHGARGLERVDDAKTFERLDRVWLDEVVADLLVVVGTRLAVDERHLETLARVERGSGAAGNAGPNDDDIKRGLTSHAGRLCSKCRRSFANLGAQSILMNP